MITIKQWAAHFRAAQASMTPKLEAVVAATAKSGAERAKAYIGVRQPALSIAEPMPVHFAGWDPLTPSTVEDKARLGFGGPDYEPLYRTGELEDSIQGSAVGLTGVIGSTDEVMVYHELGTSKMPARPVLARAVAETMPALSVALGEVGISLLKPGRR